MQAQRPDACIVLTGAELLDGRVRDRNGAFLSASLVRYGFAVRSLVVLPDDRALITATVRRLLEDGPAVLVVSGGLGTTHDDVTMQAVADAAGMPLAEDAGAWKEVRERVRAVAERRRIEVEPMLAQARRQALLPRGAQVVPPFGIAPGARLEAGPTVIVVLPGVPGELEAMWPPVLAGLVERLRPEAPTVVTMRLFGVGEMQVVPVLQPFLERDQLDVAVTASWGEISVRATARGQGGRQAALELREALISALPVYSADGRTIDEILASRLRLNGETVATAESCTGGLLGGRLTELAGSSDYYLGGVVSYSDDVKQEVLDVPAATLRRHGAVSAETARAMADGVRGLTGATYGLATTGIAGPGGGSADKPVGLVFLGISSPHGVSAVERRYPGDRESVRRWTVNGALHLLWQTLESKT